MKVVFLKNEKQQQQQQRKSHVNKILILKWVRVGFQRFSNVVQFVNQYTVLSQKLRTIKFAYFVPVNKMQFYFYTCLLTDGKSKEINCDCHFFIGYTVQIRLLWHFGTASSY